MNMFYLIMKRGLLGLLIGLSISLNCSASDVSIPLADSFCYKLDGVEHKGLCDAQSSDFSSIESSTVQNEFDQIQGDAFPRKPTTILTRSTISQKSSLKITSETTSYSDYPVVESLVWFENISKDSNTPNIKDVLAADLCLETGGDAALVVGCGEDPDPKRNYSFETVALVPRNPLEFTTREGYPSFSAFPFFVIEGKTRSYIVAIGWTGSWKARFEVDEEGFVHFTIGQAVVDLYLKPGERIRTPRVTIFEFPTGTDYVNLWRDWFRRYIMPRQSGVVLRPKLVLDVFYKGELYDLITADEQIDAIRKLRALGYPCDGLWVDAGWYLRKDKVETPVGFWFGVGDWTPDPERFPKGFRPVVDELENVKDGEKKGDLVLWYEPERVHKSQLTERLSRYVVPNCEAIESYRMNLANEETIGYLINTIGDSLQANGVSIYRQDSNGYGPQIFLESLEANDPNFNDRKGCAENKYTCGLYAFWNGLKEKNPDLVFDTCASGGRRNDLEMLRLGAVPLHYSDVGYLDFVNKQHYHDLLNRWFIYYKNIDAHDYDYGKGQFDLYKTTIDLSAFSTIRPYFFDNPTPENRNYLDRFLAIRETIVDGDYYLLRGGMNESDWTVWQFDDSRGVDSNGNVVCPSESAVARYMKDASVIPSKRQVGCVVCVRNEKAPQDTIKVNVRSIDPIATYGWENLETHSTERVSGQELVEGIDVSIPARSGVVFKYQRIE